VRVDAAVVRTNYFLRFTTPNVVRRVEIFVGRRRQPVEQEKLF
jgi:hypothetical protein